MTEKTEEGWLVSRGTSSIRIVRLSEDSVLAGDWVSEDPNDGMACFLEAMQFAKDNKLDAVVTIDDKKMVGFYERLGFETGAMVKRWEA